MNELKFSYYQLTFGTQEAYHEPEETYKRLENYGYDAIEVTPPKGRYGQGVDIQDYLKTHKRLKDKYGLEISAVNECWGEEWDPFSPNYKTLTEPDTAEKAVKETKSTIDFAAELNAPCVTVAVAIHDEITSENVEECTEIAISALRSMADYAKEKDISLVFEATNHLEMGRYVNTVANHKRMIQLAQRDNIGIQIDWFHANIEELNVYEAVQEAGDLLWHMHFRDSNSLTPGYGKVDFKSIIRAIKRINYEGYCTIESSPMVPDADTSAKDGIEYLKLLERIVDYQLEADFPTGYEVKV